MGSFEHLRTSSPSRRPTRCRRRRCARGISASSRPRSSIRSPRPAPTGARTPFPNNRIPSTIASIRWRAAYAALYPRAEPAGPRRQLLHQQLRPYDYNAFIGRVDHNFTSTNRLFVTGYWNKRQEDRYNWAQEQPTRRRAHQRLRGHPGLRLPHQPRRDHRLHRRRFPRPCCSTCAPAARASASIAIRPQEHRSSGARILAGSAPADERLPATCRS